MQPHHRRCRSVLVSVTAWCWVQASKEDVNQAIASKEPHMPSQLSEQCADFVRQCLRKDAASRPTAEELYSHPWLVRFTQGQHVFDCDATRPPAVVAAPRHGPAAPEPPSWCAQDATDLCAASMRDAAEVVHQSAPRPSNCWGARVTREKYAPPLRTGLIATASLESNTSVMSAATMEAAASVSAGVAPRDGAKIRAWHARPEQAEVEAADALRHAEHLESATPCAHPSPAPVPVRQVAGGLVMSLKGSSARGNDLPKRSNTAL